MVVLHPFQSVKVLISQKSSFCVSWKKWGWEQHKAEKICSDNAPCEYVQKSVELLHQPIVCR